MPYHAQPSPQGAVDGQRYLPPVDYYNAQCSEERKGVRPLTWNRARAIPLIARRSARRAGGWLAQWLPVPGLAADSTEPAPLALYLHSRWSIP